MSRHRRQLVVLYATATAVTAAVCFACDVILSSGSSAAQQDVAWAFVAAASLMVATRGFGGRSR